MSVCLVKFSVFCIYNTQTCLILKAERILRFVLVKATKNAKSAHPSLTWNRKMFLPNDGSFYVNDFIL